MKNLFAKSPLIYLITRGDATAAGFTEKKREILDLIAVAVAAEISLIQIREKNLDARRVFELVAESVKLTRRTTTTKILVNDRADIALAAGADGIHLTSRSVAADVIRRAFPEDFIIGVSAHTLADAKTAAKNGADFITFSPVFASPDKGKPQGLAKLREVCERLKPFPVIALGGVDATNYESVLANGASGFAAIRFLNDANNIKKISRQGAKFVN